MKGLSQLSHQMLANFYSTEEFSHCLSGFMLHCKHELQWSNIKNSASCASTLLTPAWEVGHRGLQSVWAASALSVRLFKSISLSQEARSPHQALLKVSMASLSSSEFIWGHAYWDWAVHVRVTALLLLFVSMDTGGKVALIGCLAQPVSGLFPDGGGAVAALVEQHIGLVGLKLVLWDWSHTVGG